MNECMNDVCMHACMHVGSYVCRCVGVEKCIKANNLKQNNQTKRGRVSVGRSRKRVNDWRPAFNTFVALSGKQVTCMGETGHTDTPRRFPPSRQQRGHHMPLPSTFVE